MKSEAEQGVSLDKPRAGTRRWQPYLILLGVFVAGLAVGGSLMRAQMQRGWQASMAQQRSARGRFRLEAMTRKLNLDEQQRSAIKTIVDDAETRHENAIAPCREALEQSRVAIDKQIREVLKPEQQQRFDAMNERRRKRRGRKSHRGHEGRKGRKGHRGRRHGGPPPPP